jgi:hypothetical protein
MNGVSESVNGISESAVINGSMGMQVPAEYAGKVLAMRDRGGRMSAQRNDNE